MSEDPQRAAWQYRLDRLAREEAIARGEEPDVADTAPEPARPSTQAERSAYVENAIQQAIRRGEFDNLPGAGKPLEGLTGQHDPDWWIRRKIEREQLSGLGPPALTLRVENAQLEAQPGSNAPRIRGARGSRGLQPSRDRGAPPAARRAARRDPDSGCRRRDSCMARAPRSPTAPGDRGARTARARARAEDITNPVVAASRLRARTGQGSAASDTCERSPSSLPPDLPGGRISSARG